MNVGELIEWLGNFPADADVTTVIVSPGGQCTQGGEAATGEFIIGDPLYDGAGQTIAGMNATWDYTDLKPSKYFPDGLKQLQLGVIE